jgi:hypothetical protein
LNSLKGLRHINIYIHRKDFALATSAIPSE